jgi:hypothetical protein
MALAFYSLPAFCGESLTVRTTSYPTLGNPSFAVATYDGRYVFVSVTNVGSANFSGPDSVAGTRKNVVSGIQIFRGSGIDGGGLVSAGFIPVGGTGANGLALLRDGKTLVVAVGDAGVAFLSVEDAIRGTAKPYFASQGDGAGTYNVVASPDGKVVFAANEYGVFQGQRGNVGVVAVDADAVGRVTHPRTIGRIATGDVVPSLTLSPDGSRLYVATELVPSKDPPLIAGAGNPKLTKNDCVQNKGTPPRPNGFITVIDARRAARLESNAIISRVASGCSPVRLAETADSSVLFVSARGDDTILSFATHLLESDGDHAFLRALPSGGPSPVGIRLFAQDQMLAVANSNRFADSDGTLAVLQVPNLSNSTDRVPLGTWSAGRFPRNIGISRDGKVLYLTNYSSRSLQVIQRMVR